MPEKTTHAPSRDRLQDEDVSSPTQTRRRFDAHNLGVYCFEVWGCQVIYGARVLWKEPSTTLKPAMDVAMPLGRAAMRGTQGVFRSFEGPLVLDWRDRQQIPRHLEIDLDNVFPQHGLRLSVDEAQIATGATIGPPDLLVEVTDRTVRLYLRTTLPLKRPRDAANPLSDVVEDLVPVYEQVVGSAA